MSVKEPIIRPSVANLDIHPLAPLRASAGVRRFFLVDVSAGVDVAALVVDTEEFPVFSIGHYPDNYIRAAFLSVKRAA